MATKIYLGKPPSIQYKQMMSKFGMKPMRLNGQDVSIATYDQNYTVVFVKTQEEPILIDSKNKSTILDQDLLLRYVPNIEDITNVKYSIYTVEVAPSTFKNCINLESFSGPCSWMNLSSIGDEAFSGCTNLVKFGVDFNELQYIGNNAFYNTSIYSYEAPSSKRYIYKTDLEKITYHKEALDALDDVIDLANFSDGYKTNQFIVVGNNPLHPDYPTAFTQDMDQDVMDWLECKTPITSDTNTFKAKSKIGFGAPWGFGIPLIIPFIHVNGNGMIIGGAAGGIGGGGTGNKCPYPEGECPIKGGKSGSAGAGTGGIGGGGIGGAGAIAGGTIGAGGVSGGAGAGAAGGFSVGGWTIGGAVGAGGFGQVCTVCGNGLGAAGAGAGVMVSWPKLW